MAAHRILLEAAPAGQDNWRRIDIDWLGGSTQLALQFDSLTNHTSLALAIELPSGDVLADAQVGNWLSWQEVKWSGGNKTVTGPELIESAIFYNSSTIKATTRR